jgi:hypothetical protein
LAFLFAWSSAILTFLFVGADIQHLAALRIDRPHKFRNTSIICTIGPKTNTPEGVLLSAVFLCFN